MPPLLSHLLASRHTQFGRRKRPSTPLQYLNHPISQTVEAIKRLLPDQMDRCGKKRKLSAQMIVKCFLKGLKEDHRVLTGLQTCPMLSFHNAPVS